MSPSQYVEISEVHKKYSNDEFGSFGDGQGTFRIRRRCYEEKQGRYRDEEDFEGKSVSKSNSRRRSRRHFPVDPLLSE